jgi:hypothetical protein
MRYTDLKGAVARDDYVVDPKAVAEAMLQRSRPSIASALRAVRDLTDVHTHGSNARPSGRAAEADRHRC